jgi:methylated-DNA-[protein]-cysteine S-methyltransferase
VPSRPHESTVARVYPLQPEQIRRPYEDTAMNTHTTVTSPIGDLTLINTDHVLTGLYFAGHNQPKGLDALGSRTDHGFEDTIEQLGEYFAGRRTTFTLTTRARGTVFQRRVWALIEQIPYGQTATYTDLARALGDPGLSRAVGSAGARNPLCLLIPCHRVLGSNGALSGYAGGLPAKQHLLSLEATACRRRR